MKLKSINQIRKLLNANLEEDFPFSGINIDSRTIKPGEIFWSLPGLKVDGEAFLSEAFSKGAVAAVVSRNYNANFHNKTLIRVDDRLSALQEAASALIQSAPPKEIINVTGSAGKTTIKEFLATLLQGSYSIFKTAANYNTKITIPLQIVNGWSDQEVMILEMGMTHPGDLSQLIKIAPPDIALINTVSLTHAENFSSLQEIAKAKAEIFSHSKTRLGFYGKQIEEILNLQNEGKCEKRTYAIEGVSCDYAFMQPGDWYFKAKGDYISLKNLPKLGHHHLHNLLGAMAIAHELKVPLDRLKKQLELIQLPERRFEKKIKKGIMFFDDSYNASQEAMIAAFKSLPEQGKGSKRYAVLGSMLELGAFSLACHQRVGEEALNYFDQLFCFGEECQVIVDIWKKNGKPAQLYSDHQSIVNALGKVVCTGDVVLLKGSNSKQIWKVFEEF